MTTDPYVIRYFSRSITNDEPVGMVYVQRVRDRVPQYDVEDAYSYTKDPAQASVWATYEEARDLAQGKFWNEWEVLPLSRAEALPEADARLCPECQRVMSYREQDEQGSCNDCYSARQW